jgi:phospholipid-transporting ATPase
VQLIREYEPHRKLLAIGDGANDVSMIAEANIGVGISGSEGNQAVSSSDYAIGQFKHLKTLMLYHGRESYRRNAYLICYMFYKNLLQNAPMFIYGVVSGFSGQIFYETIMTQTFNLIFTSWPIIIYAKGSPS